MYRLCVNFEHIIVASKKENVSILNLLKNLKVNGISGLDIDYCYLKDNLYLKDILLSGLEIACIYYKSDIAENTNINNVIGVVDRATELKVKNIMLITQPTKNDITNLTLLKQNLRRIVNYASNFDIKVSIENFGLNEYLSSLENNLNILKSVKNLGITYDIGNMYYYGEDLEVATNSLLKYIQKVHLKDCTNKETQSPFKINNKNEKIFTTSIGLGDCNINSICDIIKKEYNNLDFTLEFDFNDKDVLSKILESANYFYTEIVENGQD